MIFSELERGFLRQPKKFEATSKKSNLEKWRAEPFLVKFLLNTPRRSRERSGVEERSDEEVEKKSYIKGEAQYIIRIKGQKGTCFNYAVVTIRRFIKYLLLLDTMADKIPRDALKIAGALSRESGVPLDDILHAPHVKAGEVAEKRKSDSGKFKVLGIDKFDGEDWVDRKSTRLNSSHIPLSRMPSSA